MGMFGGKSPSDESSMWDTRAKEAERQAREETSKAAACRRRLDSGTSDDPKADERMLQQHYQNRRIAEGKVRRFKAAAKRAREARG